MARRKKGLKYPTCGCNAGFEGGIVLDPFMGSGTTALVARELGRRYIGIELNPAYCRIAETRLSGSSRPRLR
ncbi:MAG: site-specific DNA-methyltransferase [Candidatus Rokubacteria bacterium]|nr:site-specific DNA-methyltransferase [Candidatus Rokubacteria bacterium]